MRDNRLWHRLTLAAWLACGVVGMVLVPPAAPAQRPHTWLIWRSAAVSNLSAWVIMANPPTASNRITFGFSSLTTNEVTLYIPPLREPPFCKVEMTDAQGHRLKKTELGAKLLFLERTNAFGLNHFRKTYGWKQLTPYTASPTNIGSAACSFRTPAELFEITKPGQYKLTIEFQALRMRGRSNVVVSFPPIEIPIMLSDKTTHN